MTGKVVVTVTTAIKRLRQVPTFARAAALAAVALVATLLGPSEARAQWTTSGNTTSTTNNVGVGTASPEQPFHVNGGTVLSTGTYAGFSFRNRGSASSTDDWVWYSSGNVARFWRGGTDLLGVTNDGKFGVGTSSPATRLDVVGAANIWSGDRYAVTQGKMAPGTLTIGNAAANFGGGTGWTTNTAGLMLEASDNTEIAVHDYGTRLASFMYYEGAAANRLSIGRDMGFGAIGTLSLNGNVGVGTATPGVKLAVNGPGVNVYNTDAWIENNLHAQGNEPLTQGGGRGRMRLGSAWGYSGVYADVSSLNTGNDLVLGASSGTVRIGPGVGAPQSLIVPNGNFGVGTATPGFRLDVQGGAVNAAGGLCIAGDCKTSWAQTGGGWTSSGSAATLSNVAANIWAGGAFAVPQGYMKPGSLTIGSTGASFGGGSSWNANTAGLLLETAASTEIAVHDGGTRIASLMHYEGDAANRITIGRDMAWGPISTIALNGNVGIGTASPTQRLTIDNPVDNGSAANVRLRSLTTRYRADMAMQGAGGLGINSYDDATATYLPIQVDASTTILGTKGNVGVGTNAPAAKLDVNGDIRVSGNINAKYQDVAEWVPSKQRLAAGTVVVLDTAELNHVRESARAYDTGVAGVISAQPGLSLGEAGEGKVLVATTGRVKVKVDASRGAIKVGDLLVTSDVVGVAMRSQPLELGGVPIHRPGTIIGKALEPLAGGTGEILVLLSLQ